MRKRLNLALLLLTVRSVAVCLQVRVTTTGELYDGLRRPEVDSVIAPRKALFNLSQFPDAVELTRAVQLEGEGPGPVLDVGGLRRIHVGPGGQLLVRNFQAMGCIAEQQGVGCLATLSPGGNLTLLDLTICDPGGWSTKSSWYSALGTASMTTLHLEASQPHLSQFVLQDLSLPHGSKVAPKLLEDSGIIQEYPQGSVLRLANITILFECDAKSLSSDRQRSFGGVLSALYIGVAAAVAALSCAYLFVFGRRKVINVVADTPEQAIARANGVVLEEVLGKGSFGTVYRGSWQGQTVAVKVIGFTSADQAALERVEREFLHGQAGCKYLVQTLHFFTCAVEQERAAPMKKSSGSLREIKHLRRGSTSTNDSQSHGPLRADTAGNADSSSTRAAPGGYTGSVAFIVMQYVEGGTLLEAVRDGHFLIAMNTVNLRSVYATALDIVRGLEYLHQSMHLVHRDLSCANVLLAIDTADPRGFTALLSDFGLSMALQESQSHRISPGKGTIDYMPPEAFASGRISPAFDIYSLGIILYTLFCGRTPYQNMPQYKVAAAKAEKGSQLPLPSIIPRAGSKLISNCIQWDPTNRPNAGGVRQALEALLEGVDE